MLYHTVRCTVHRMNWGQSSRIGVSPCRIGVMSDWGQSMSTYIISSEKTVHPVSGQWFLLPRSQSERSTYSCRWVLFEARLGTPEGYFIVSDFIR